MITSKATLTSAKKSGILVPYLRGTMSVSSGFFSFGISTSAGNTANGLVPTSADTTWAKIKVTNIAAGNIRYIGTAHALTSIATILATTAPFIYDRLFHCGAYNIATVGTTTLTAQPSYSSRVNDYKECEIILEAVTAITAGSSVEITYTNENGVTGRTTSAQAIAATVLNSGVQFPLQSGDSGVQKIEAIIITGGTGTGTFNIMVMRRLTNSSFSNGHNVQAIRSEFQNLFPEVKDNSCLNIGAVGATGSVSVVTILPTMIEG